MEVPKVAELIQEICHEDLCNDTYGRIRMYQALQLKNPDSIPIPSESTVYRIMKKQCVTDITEIKAKDGKLYTSVIFDCFDLSVLGISMSTNMKADLCVHTLDYAVTSYPSLRGAIIHSDRGAQYTSEQYRQGLYQYGIRQSMNSAGGRCHDNARCESMWARMKTELFYDRYDSEQMTVEQLKSLVWRYFMSYWNNRRICSANGGLPPAVKRQRFYENQRTAA